MSIAAESDPKFIYQAYGARRFRVQAELSIRSLLAHGVSADHVLVFTDCPREFSGLAGEILKTTPALLRQWAGPCGFHHRIKVELIRRVCSRHSGPVIYVDSDTIWRESPQNVYSDLHDGHFVMHQCEAMLSDRFFPEYRSALHRLEARGQLGALAGHVNEVRMYNAGIIGLPRQRGDVLDRVLSLCDDLSVLVPRRMEVAEQLAFSYVLPCYGAVQTCPKPVLHYWCDCFEVCHALESMTPEAIERLAKDPIEFERLIAEGQTRRNSIANQYRKRAARLSQSLARRKREIKALIARWGRAA